MVPDNRMIANIYFLIILERTLKVRFTLNKCLSVQYVPFDCRYNIIQQILELIYLA